MLLFTLRMVVIDHSVAGGAPQLVAFKVYEDHEEVLKYLAGYSEHFAGL